MGMININNKNEIMRILLFLSFFILLFSAVAMAEETSGKIYQLGYTPEEPLTLEDTKILVGIENNGNLTENYTLVLQITKTGKIVNEEEFSFKIGGGKTVFISPTFTPVEIGEFEIIGKLYDKYKINLLDTRIVKFYVTSHIGPFDISVDLLTHKIRPGKILPTVVHLKNVGTRGTDVEVKLEILCRNQEKIYKTLTAYVPPSSTANEMVSIQVCNDAGLYDITGTILLLNRSVASSVNQFLINDSFVELSLDIPELIKVRAGESKVFDIVVTNLGNEKINNLKFAIEKIPLSWQKITPAYISEVSPGEKVVFVINLTIPQDVKSESYLINIISAAEETLVRKGSKLQIISSDMTVAQPPVIIQPSFPSFWIFLMASGLITAIGTFVIHMMKRSASKKPRALDALRKIRRKVVKY